MSKPRVLVYRTDKLGDVLLSLPALKVLRDSAPEWRIQFVCSDAIAKVIGATLKTWGVEWVASFSKAEACLFLHATFPIAWQAFSGRVPVRVGQYTKPWSFLFFNAGIRQRRSLATWNEAEYSIELVHCLLEKMGHKKVEFSSPVILEKGDVKNAQARVAALGVKSDFVVIHPGMGGSALNVSPLVYAEIFKEMKTKGFEVILSEGPEDKKMVESVAGLVGGAPILKNISLEMLCEVFRMAKWVVAPSTGPLHLAHVVGTDVIGLYPPLKSQHPKRWQPWGGKGKVTILSPGVDCPAHQACLGSACSQYPCMDTYPWVQKFRQICQVS